jgi:hypothetical protein
MISESPDSQSEHTTDEAILARLGYKQELRREFTPLEVSPVSEASNWPHTTANVAPAKVFGVAFSIVGLVPSIAYAASLKDGEFLLMEGHSGRSSSMPCLTVVLFLWFGV